MHVKAVAILFAYWHGSHTHIEHKIWYSASYNNFWTAETSTMSKLFLRNSSHIDNETRVLDNLQILIQDFSFLKITAS